MLDYRFFGEHILKKTNYFSFSFTVDSDETFKVAFTLIVELNVFDDYASLNPNTNSVRTFLFIYSYNVGIMKYPLLLTFKESVTRLNIIIDNT